ncbi:MAG: hypothetical protein WC733_00095 [Methylophilus sp.]|jgi:hypothetical protein
MARIQGMGIGKEWQAQYDLNTLLEACKIKKDPARMKAVRAEAKRMKSEKVDELTEVAEIAEEKDSD